MDNLDNMKSYLKEYAELRETKKGIEARMKELDKLVRPALMDKGKIAYEGYTFSLTTVAGRKTLDRKAVEAAGIDLTPYEKVGTPFTQLRIEEVETLK